MDIIEQEIEKAKESEAFLAELALALTIPSVCSRFLFSTKKTESVRYPEWYNKYVEFPGLDGNECYALRCALLHNGDDELEKQSILKNDATYQENRYKLHIPYSGDIFGFEREDNFKEFCVAGLAVCILDGYRAFKGEYPSFKYPLNEKNLEVSHGSL